MSAARAAILDMGGVLLDMGPGGGLPFGDFERLGRQRLLSLLSGSGLGERELDQLFFEPWLAGYAGRRERGREEVVGPHLARLAAAAGGLGARTLLDAWFEPYGGWLESLPAVGESVEALARSGWRLAVVSNVPLPGRLYRRVLERLGLLSSFEETLFSHDEGSRKPSPQMLSRALERLGVPPSRAVMVGDRKVEDVGSAEALGVRSVWIESSFDQGPEPDRIIPDLGQLPELLSGWDWWR